MLNLTSIAQQAGPLLNNFTTLKDSPAREAAIRMERGNALAKKLKGAPDGELPFKWLAFTVHSL